jgi:Tfp pilus assembly protein PilF
MSKTLLPKTLFLCVALGVAALPACGGSSTRTNGSGKLEAPKLPPVNPLALRDFDAGLRALKLGGPEAHDKAVERFRSAIEIDGKLWEAWHNLGAVQLEDGDGKTAAESFGNALKINPVHRGAIAGRAEAYRLSGQNKKAAKDYRRLIELTPTVVAPYARFASLLRVSGDYEDGLDLLREALRVGGATSDIYVELGLIYLAQGRDDLAKLVLKKSVELDSKNPSVYNAMALVAMGEGDDQLAFSYFDKASELDPNYVDTRFNKAGVLLDAGDYQGAQVELDGIIKIAPDDMAAQVALGVAYRGMGNHDRARNTWKAVVKKASRRGKDRGDALFNIAILELDFIMDDKKAKAALDRYLQNSGENHAKRKEAAELRKDLDE